MGIRRHVQTIPLAKESRKCACSVSNGYLKLEPALIGLLEQAGLSSGRIVRCKTRQELVLHLLGGEWELLADHGVEQGSCPFSEERADSIAACVGQCLLQVPGKTGGLFGSGIIGGVDGVTGTRGDGGADGVTGTRGDGTAMEGGEGAPPPPPLRGGSAQSEPERCPSLLFFRLPAPCPQRRTPALSVARPHGRTPALSAARPHPCPQRRPPLPLPALLPRRRRPHSTPPVVVIVRTPAAIVPSAPLLPSAVADLLPDSRRLLPLLSSPLPNSSRRCLLPSLSPPVVATSSSSPPRRRSSRRFSRRLPLVLPCLASPDSSPLPTVAPLLSAAAAAPLRQQLHLQFSIRVPAPDSSSPLNTLCLLQSAL
ncbi:hypothetical protein ACLOJK_010734 [Asimina triloba]